MDFGLAERAVRVRFAAAGNQMTMDPAKRRSGDWLYYRTNSRSAVFSASGRAREPERDHMEPYLSSGREAGKSVDWLLTGDEEKQNIYV
jgi:hypothetical protein